MLERAAAAVGPLLQSQVACLAPRTRDACGRHFGWPAGAVPATVGSGGKFVRAALALLSCEAASGEPRMALTAAVAVELVHNASLLHDDIIDGETIRRGRPALWVDIGVPGAILAGDALFFAAVQALTAAPRWERSVPVLLACVQALIEGEFADVLMESSVDTGEDQVLAVAAAKTGVLLACACELGAIAANASAKRAAHLRAFGSNLGIAFQNADDLIDVWGRSETTGKPTRSDLRAHKISLPVAAAMASISPAARELRALFLRETPLDEEQCARAAALIEEAGGREATERSVRKHADEALRHLQLAAPAKDAEQALTALVDRLVHRDR
ncbi:polyprenyl synthetase family protein [Streptomyces wuyuanensis]|uniref:polyprenyl synthetase family protein n=1 Tax=Streptomyces wuyuanensis TaxID=1196353 RepID=UPI0034148402